jgi:UDP-2,3-diacylglucosamine pyrophosphatase LpxH
MCIGKYYPVVVLSDLHLGTIHSKAKEVVDFLGSIRCERLILNGDIIDGWQLNKGGLRKWQSQYTDVFNVINRMIKEHNTEVIYVLGNHDDFLLNIVPYSFSNIKIVKDYILETDNKRYYVTHGDVFDKVTTRMKWLSMLGDFGYTALLWLNRFYNSYRLRVGKPYRTISQSVKQKVKTAVSYISDFETELVKLAKRDGYDGIICGHIHHPANTYYEGIHYLNSGDWVETMSALTLSADGVWNVDYYQEALQTEFGLQIGPVLTTYSQAV